MMALTWRNFCSEYWSVSSPASASSVQARRSARKSRISMLAVAAVLQPDIAARVVVDLDQRLVDGLDAFLDQVDLLVELRLEAGDVADRVGVQVGLELGLEPGQVVLHQPSVQRAVLVGRPPPSRPARRSPAGSCAGSGSSRWRSVGQLVSRPVRASICWSAVPRQFASAAGPSRPASPVSGVADRVAPSLVEARGGRARRGRLPTACPRLRQRGSWRLPGLSRSRRSACAASSLSPCRRP